jgi:hypothetical protein
MKRATFDTILANQDRRTSARIEILARTRCTKHAPGIWPISKFLNTRCGWCRHCDRGCCYIRVGLGHDLLPAKAGSKIVGARLVFRVCVTYAVTKHFVDARCTPAASVVLADAGVAQTIVGRGGCAGAR